MWAQLGKVPWVPLLIMDKQELAVGPLSLNSSAVQVFFFFYNFFNDSAYGSFPANTKDVINQPLSKVSHQPKPAEYFFYGCKRRNKWFHQFLFILLRCRLFLIAESYLSEMIFLRVSAWLLLHIKTQYERKLPRPWQTALALSVFELSYNPWYMIN